MDRLSIAIVGPTGAGKSSLAIDLAGSFSGEIVNCDSLQFYRGFDVGTAKTPEAARRGIPHHLFDALDPETGYSAGDYTRQARETMQDISARGRLPVIVGGTGFYLRALLEGLPGLPGRDEALRDRLAARERRRAGALHRLLRRLEPSAAARIHPNDVQKLIRALEIRILTRSALPPPCTADPLRGYRVVKIGLDPDRPALFARLDARVIAMFCSGLLEEVRAHLAAGLTGEEKPFESLGYKQALLHINGALTLEQAIESAQIETRQYAKRQWTWFRRDAEVRWIKGFGDDPATAEDARRILGETLNSPAR